MPVINVKPKKLHTFTLALSPRSLHDSNVPSETISPITNTKLATCEVLVALLNNEV